MLVEISQNQELEDVLDTNEDVVVCFTAPGWCVPCQRLEPHYQLAAETSSDAIFVKIDIDKSDEILSQAVQAVPTVIYFKNGEPVGPVVSRTALKIKEEVSHLVSS